MAIDPILMALLVAVPLLLLVAIIVAARRAKDRGERFGIKLTLSGSAFVAGILTLASGVMLIGLLNSPQLAMNLPVQAQDLGTIETLPGRSTIVGGIGAETISAMVENVPGDARAMWAIGSSLSLFVPAVISALIALACFQLLRGAPFAPALSRATGITAVVVLVGGLASEVMTQWAGSIVADEALSIQGAAGQQFAATFEITIPLWPVGAAFGLAALATIFAFGTRLQKDTEGLV